MVTNIPPARCVGGAEKSYEAVKNFFIACCGCIDIGFVFGV